MLFMDGSAAVKICNGAGNFENSGIGTSGETEPVGDQFQHAVAGGVELAVFSYVAGCHLGVAVDFSAFVTFQLDFSGAFNPLGNGGRAFGLATVSQVTVFDRWHFDVDVDPVQQRP